MPNTEKAIVLSSGTCTYWDEGESARTLVLLHGFALREGMRPLMDALRPHFRLLIPALPFSRREAFSRPHTLTDYTAFLLEWLDRLELERCSLFGNSVGGTLALLLALTQPGRFDHLIVRAPLVSRRDLPIWLRIAPLVGLHQRLSGSRWYAATVTQAFYRISARMSPSGVEMEAGPRSRALPYADGEIDERILSRFLGHLLRTEFRARLTQIPNRTLVLWGARDSFIPPLRGARLAADLPAAVFRSMPGEYHNIATVDVQRLAQLIMDFQANEFPLPKGEGGG